MGITAAVALRYASHRGRLARFERRTPELWATAANLALMMWSMREMQHVAQVMVRRGAPAGAPDSEEAVLREYALAAALASVAWLGQAVFVLVAGWLRDLPFLRWTGLVLLGITLFKFLVFDLQTIDVFWRFLTAIAVGAAMLAFSYAYQLRMRGAKAGD